MAKKVKTMDEVPVDVFQSVRRALLRRGFVRRRRPKQPPAEPAAAQQQSDDTKPSEEEERGREHPFESGEVASQEIHEKLIDITEKAQDVLFKSDTVFPFTLFPDTITLDREKLTVASRSFFRVAKIVSVPVSSISSAEVDVGPIFGSLHMASKYFVQNTYSVNFLWRENALKLQHLLQGFIIAQEKNIDVTDIDKRDLLILLGDLGQGVSE